MRKIVELKIEETKTVVGGTKLAATTVSAQSTSVTAKEMRTALAQGADSSLYV